MMSSSQTVYQQERSQSAFLICTLHSKEMKVDERNSRRLINLTIALIRELAPILGRKRERIESKS